VIAAWCWELIEPYLKRNLLTPVAWTGEEANTYLDGLNAKYVKALGDLGALKKK